MAIISKSELRNFASTRRTFSKSFSDTLNEARSTTKTSKVTIFLSHKHNESRELADAIEFLSSFDVSIYVDWMDDQMPTVTSGKTARRIKSKIVENRKFILLATEGAINSKWCNWELGFGDSKKYIEHIAILPVKDDYSGYSGSEYLQIYPYIESRDGTTKNSAGYIIPKGYYVFTPNDDGTRNYVALSEWLKS